MNQPEHVRVVAATRDIAAPIDTIFDLIATPSRQPEWDGNDNLANSAAGTRIRGAGETFDMELTNGKLRTNHVVEFEEARRIAWRPAAAGQSPPGHLWRWELEPVGHGRTRVTHTYDWTELTDERRFPRARATTSARLLQSIDRLADLAEHGQHHSEPDHAHDWAALTHELVGEGEMLLPYLHAALDDLDTVFAAPPQRILDVGAGPGVYATAIAERYPNSETIAVDGSSDLLARAAARAAEHGVRLGTRHTSFPDGFAELPQADLIWSAQTLHHVGDHRGAVRALAGRLRPGGVLAVAEGGLPLRYLPGDIGSGRPGLQERLDAAASSGFAHMRAELDHRVHEPEDWSHMLRDAGLTEVRARTYLVDRPAPLDAETRRTVATMLGRFTRAVDALDPADAATIARLVDAEDPASVLHRGDVFVLTARTVYTGVAE